MPLGHRSLSHGVVAFGFFNVDTDCLLLNNVFFFASDFCAWVQRWATEGPPQEERVPVYVIHNQSDIGNLHWSIQGHDHHGFIPHVHRIYPFPAAPEDFKQKPEGWQVRDVIEPILREYASLEDMVVRFDEAKGLIHLGEFIFDRSGFRELLDYVWRGGMPMWRANERPQYVLDMIEAVRTSPYWPFQGMCRAY